MALPKEEWRPLRGLLTCAALVAVVALAGCGGGGDDKATSTNPSGTSTPTTPPAAPPISISGFKPTSGSVGATVTVTGAGFNGVQAVRLGSVAATFKVNSDTQLQFTVPVGATGSRIELAATGRTVLSATDFIVRSAPQVTRVSPASVPPGGRVTLSGSNLDRVTQVRVGELAFPTVSKTVNSMVIEAPADARSGTITVIDSDGIARPQSQQLTVVGPMTIASFSPAWVLTGQTLTIVGTNLERATGVAFAGGSVAAVELRTGSTQIIVRVPDSATSGTITVLGDSGDQVSSGTPLKVSTLIRVTNPNATYPVAAAGANVTVTGSGFSDVTGVTVGGTPAEIVSRTATQLTFTVPSGLRCGEIALKSENQQDVAAGSVVVGKGCPAKLAGIELGQVLSQTTAEPWQRLVPGKETWVRAYVVSQAAEATPAPTVRVTGYQGTTILGTVELTGPATLPSTGGTVTDAERYNEAKTFNAELPPSWVASGLSLRIEVDAEQLVGPTITQDVEPNVGADTRLEIVLVPVVAGIYVPTVPSEAAVLDEITRRFPIPRERITVSTRVAYKLSSVTSGVDTVEEWSDALDELRQLRDNENASNSGRHYFGFVRRTGGSVAGIAYRPGNAALGFDSAAAWWYVMTHELGHNFSLPHAPCGNPANVDKFFPYSDGSLGPQPLLDSVPAMLDVISPVGETDVMGYCDGVWFSDYNYRRMQTHLESELQTTGTSEQAGGEPTDMLMIAGALRADGVRLRPVQALRATPAYRTGAYMIRLVTRDGRTIDTPFDAAEVDHAVPPERHFSVALVNPGPLERIEVWHGQAQLPMAGGMATAQRATTVREQLTIDWSERNGELTLRWNTTAASHASVTHVLNGKRTVLGLQRQGGELVADTTGLPAGGTFEFSLSDGLNAQLVTVAR